MVFFRLIKAVRQHVRAKNYGRTLSHANSNPYNRLTQLTLIDLDWPTIGQSKPDMIPIHLRKTVASQVSPVVPCAASVNPGRHFRSRADGVERERRRSTVRPMPHPARAPGLAPSGRRVSADAGSGTPDWTARAAGRTPLDGAAGAHRRAQSPTGLPADRAVAPAGPHPNGWPEDPAFGGIIPAKVGRSERRSGRRCRPKPGRRTGFHGRLAIVASMSG